MHSSYKLSKKVITMLAIAFILVGIVVLNPPVISKAAADDDEQRFAGEWNIKIW